ncbi:magnesium transporter CorA family protein [Falsirhodobacter algicola]|uniref:Magnesium transport protein CorA n=1 Tax=Falsirhodobacter algicola TaxID=2692330 RepID=A0A8J8MU10_9RHOB|nr:magnesium transporter CorA family protein [Falsirhodobacter algicola]QUS36680.1 magnesium transporter [Falsirhodobacter algicola]
MIEYHSLTDGALCSAEGVPEAGAPALWIDLCNPTRWEERLIAERVGIAVPTRAEMTEIEDSSRLYVDGRALVMTVAVIEGMADGRPRRAQVTFVLLPQVLITVRHANPVPLRTIAARVARNPGESDTAPRLMATILEAFVERIADVLEQVSADLNTISDMVFFEDAAEPQEQDLKRLVQRLGRQNRTLSILRESLLSFDRLLPFLRDATSGKAAKTEDEPAPNVARLSSKGAARLKAIERDVKSLSAYEAQTEQELTFLHAATIGLIGVEQNQIIKALSVAAALFLPPTLVGTVYGMNFRDMPELGWQYGYPIALGAMAVSALLPYLWFRRRKWL